MYLNDELKREFYIQMTRIENWNTRVLNEKIDLPNLKNLNAVFINKELQQSNRLLKLNQIAIQQ